MSVRPYTHGTNSVENAQLQAALKKYAVIEGVPAMDPGALDGDFGHQTTAAVIAAQQHWSLVADGFVRDDLLVFLGLKTATGPSIFDQIGTVLSIINLLKGKTMTQDQINGVIRAVLTAAGGFLIGRGLITAEMWTWLSAGVLTIGPMVWSWISNRPKTIVPIAAK